jgi:hypothetical protein
MTCGSASIADSGQFAGEANIEDPDIIAGYWRERGRLRVLRDYQLLMRGRIMAFMAGAETEVVLLGSFAGGDEEDRYQIDWMAGTSDANFTPDQWRRREPRMRATTRRLVRHYREAIKRVAATLLIHKTLSDEDIDAMV